MPFSPLDLGQLVRALNREPELRYVLVGGLAVTAHGGTRITEDVDIAIAFDEANRRAVVRALAPLNPQPIRSSPGATWVWDELSIRPPWTVIATTAGRVDLIIRLPEIESFDALHERSETILFEGLPFRVAAIDDLITMKRVANRDRDRDDVNQLLAIKKLIEEEAEN